MSLFVIPILIIFICCIVFGFKKFPIKSEIKLYFAYSLCAIIIWSIYHIFMMGPMSTVQFVPAGFLVILASPVILPIVLILNGIYIKKNDFDNKGKRFAINIFHTVIWLIVMAIIISLVAPITDIIANSIA